MNPYPRINLPPPPPATRQAGVGFRGSPISLSRGSSSISDTRTPEEVVRDSLVAYKMFLEHEIQFLESEISALIERQPDQNPRQEAAMLTLRNGLKIRFNTQSVKMARINALLDVM